MQKAKYVIFVSLSLSSLIQTCSLLNFYVFFWNDDSKQNFLMISLILIVYYLGNLIIGTIIIEINGSNALSFISVLTTMNLVLFRYSNFYEKPMLSLTLSYNQSKYFKLYLALRTVFCTTLAVIVSILVINSCSSRVSIQSAQEVLFLSIFEISSSFITII